VVHSPWYQPWKNLWSLVLQLQSHQFTRSFMLLECTMLYPLSLRFPSGWGPPVISWFINQYNLH
jgi:hypothetical protein